MSKNLLFAVIALTVIGIAILSVQNASPAVVSFLFWQSISLPLGVILALTFAIGLLMPMFWL
ncbi:LapA family protein [Thermosynechococcaceae cyanobacterium BACA0444]|uniref:LapA family protein n=1 Tax=Pseudocalidococcus azoricus BACA0444 TaxID=2918990 RepID=A0AAE4FSU7_9CYAN|nr:LapA family protein [Pseudocalidococcus azoricus]MDS3860335.1 LapA family protein [Pseudocalidococcus azoricus BACA0444]